VPIASRPTFCGFCLGTRGHTLPVAVQWLHRPENGFGRLRSVDGRDAPKAIRIFHHKTGAVVLHPLQDGDGTLFHSDAEEVLAKVPRRGIPMILRETRDNTQRGQPKPSKLYSESGMPKLVRRLREEAGLPSTFTTPVGMVA
jgi:hypothetical protein